MWIFSIVTGFISAVLTAILNGYSGLLWLLIIPLSIGYTAAILLVLFIIAFIATAPVNIERPIKKPHRFYTFLFNVFNDFICTTARIKIKITGGELLKKGERYLFVYNHRSNFDPMLISKYFKRYKILMVSKPQNFKKFLAGKCIHMAGFMAIDRDNDREAIKTISKSVDYIKKGYSVGIAPEGTRNKLGTGLLPFKSGAFKIATKARAPICVMFLNGTQDIHKNFPFKKTVVTLDILKVIEPEEYQDKNTLTISEQVRDLMEHDIALKNARGE